MQPGIGKMIAAWKELFSRNLKESANACSIDVDAIVQSSYDRQCVYMLKVLQWLRKIPAPAGRSFGEGGGSHFGL